MSLEKTMGGTRRRFRVGVWRCRTAFVRAEDDALFRARFHVFLRNILRRSGEEAVVMKPVGWLARRRTVLRSDAGPVEAPEGGEVALVEEEELSGRIHFVYDVLLCFPGRIGLGSSNEFDVSDVGVASVEERIPHGMTLRFFIMVVLSRWSREARSTAATCEWTVVGPGFESWEVDVGAFTLQDRWSVGRPRFPTA